MHSVKLGYLIHLQRKASTWFKSKSLPYGPGSRKGWSKTPHIYKLRAKYLAKRRIWAWGGFWHTSESMRQGLRKTVESKFVKPVIKINNSDISHNGYHLLNPPFFKSNALHTLFYPPPTSYKHHLYHLKISMSLVLLPLHYRWETESQKDYITWSWS